VLFTRELFGSPRRMLFTRELFGYSSHIGLLVRLSVRLSVCCCRHKPGLLGCLSVVLVCQ
jgi:hypothetical protein